MSTSSNHENANGNQDMQTRIANALTKQYMELNLNNKHSTIYFFMEKNTGIPESRIHVECSKSSRWWSNGRKIGFMTHKRLRPITSNEFFDCIKGADISDIYIYERNGEVLCQNNQANKFVQRCILEFNKMYEHEDEVRGYLPMRMLHEKLMHENSIKINDHVDVSVPVEIKK